MGERAISDEQIVAVHDAFTRTEYGQQLALSNRFARYNLADLSPIEWSGLLGADVNNLTHMPLTYGLARRFIAHQYSGSPDDVVLDEHYQALLKLGSIIHDEAESITTDITKRDKTEADEVEEEDVFHAHLTDFHPGVDRHTLTWISYAVDEVVFGKQDKHKATEVYRAFDGVERIGYVRMLFAQL